MLARKKINESEFLTLWRETDYGIPTLKMFQSHEILPSFLSLYVEGLPNAHTVFNRLIIKTQWDVVDHLLENNILTKECIISEEKALVSGLKAAKKWDLTVKLMDKDLLQLSRMGAASAEIVEHLNAHIDLTAEKFAKISKVLRDLFAFRVFLPEIVMEYLYNDYLLKINRFKPSIDRTILKYEEGEKNEFRDQMLKSAMNIYKLYFDFSAGDLSDIYMDSLKINLNLQLRDALNFYLMNNIFKELFIVLFADAAENGIKFSRKQAQKFVESAVEKYFSLSPHEKHILEEAPLSQHKKIDQLIPVLGFFSKDKPKEIELKSVSRVAYLPKL